MWIELLYHGHWTVCSYKIAKWNDHMTKDLHKLSRLEGHRQLGLLLILKEVDSATFV